MKGFLMTPKHIRIALWVIGAITAIAPIITDALQSAEGGAISWHSLIVAVGMALFGYATKAPGTLTQEEASAKAEQVRRDATAATRAALGFSDDGEP